MISVIIPLYNKEPIIERTLKSVLSQDYDDFEVIIVNDGSTDKSADIVKSINNPHIRLIEQENGGPSKARNTGVKTAKGEWIVFLDADDEFLPYTLDIFRVYTNTYKDADIIDFGSIDKSTNKYYMMPHSFEGYSKNNYKNWYFWNISPGSNHSIFKRDILLKHPYNTKIRRYEDFDLLSRILSDAKVYACRIPVSLVNKEYANASKPRKDVSEDYMGHLNFHGNFWLKMNTFRFFIHERENYSETCHKLYTRLYKRYDLLILYKLLSYFG